MQDLVEIIFEEIDFNMLDAAIISLVSSEENIITIDTFESVPRIEKKYWKNLHQLLDYNAENSSCFFHIKNIFLKEIVINYPTIQILKYAGKIDIVIIVDTADSNIFSNEDDILKIKKWACSFLSLYHVKNCYCALEPAQDKPTRLFTNNKLGPLTCL